MVGKLCGELVGTDGSVGTLGIAPVVLVLYSGNGGIRRVTSGSVGSTTGEMFSAFHRGGRGSLTLSLSILTVLVLFNNSIVLAPLGLRGVVERGGTGLGVLARRSSLIRKSCSLRAYSSCNLWILLWTSTN